MSNLENVIERAKKELDKMLDKNIPGQNWDGIRFSTFGDGKKAMRGDPEPIRMECWAKDGKSDPIIRTSLDYELKQGMMIWIEEDDNRFFLIEKRSQKQVDCYKAVGVPCNARITVFCIRPDRVNEDGQLIEAGGRTDYIWSFPCVRKYDTSASSIQGVPGLVPARQEVFTLQQNPATATIIVGDKVDTDGRIYTIIDVIKSEHGIMRLFCIADAGSVSAA